MVKMIEFFEPYFSFSDSRGSILGINNRFAFEEINLITSEKNCIRGGHYHKKTLEFFYILEGKIHITLFHISDPKKINNILVEQGQIFCIFPNIVHTFEIIDKSTWINMLDRKMEDDNKDFFTPHIKEEP